MSPLEISKEDIAPFADLGTGVEATGSGFRLKRNGADLKVEACETGYVVTTFDQAEKFFPSGSSLLSSAIFADLTKIARNQAVILATQRIEGSPIPVTANMKSVRGEVPEFISNGKPWEALDKWLIDQQKSQAASGTDILLIDGPAGVGKTTIVREAALLRAERYDGSFPLILQIASRGRVLQNIGDLIAFSLQDIRSNLTISQLTTLIRHGLITLAVDGFDELSDPNGFQTAWSGLNNLVSDVRGNATLLLAGRETFVSTATMLRQLTSFNANSDRLASLSLADPNPDAAREWLLQQDGWDYDSLGGDFVEPIFETGSYALRPFFLDVIAREPAALKGNEPPASDLLSFLVEVMIRREAQKFIEVFDPPNESESSKRYQSYVGRFLEEVARDLGENQSEAIADDALDLLATVAADGILPEDQVPAVVQRARTVVFLANDLHAGHIRFAHEQLLQHFLAREALRSVGEGETPRYVKRNLFGREALEVFGHVARGRVEEAKVFLSAVRCGLAKPSRDRTNTNLAVLGVSAACAVLSDGADLLVRDVGINELHFPFSPPPGIVLRDTTVSILHAAGVDLSAVEFQQGVSIATLEIDERTILPDTIPMPHLLVRPGETISNAAEIAGLIEPRDEREAGLPWSASLRELLDRIERYRAFWLRTNMDDADSQGRRIIAHADWPRFLDAARALDLITIKARQAAGAHGEFVHFRQDMTLSENDALFDALT